jgi:hypothetical protein
VGATGKLRLKKANLGRQNDPPCRYHWYAFAVEETMSAMQEGSDSPKRQKAPDGYVQILWRPDTTEAEDEMMGHFARDKKDFFPARFFYSRGQINW